MVYVYEKSSFSREKDRYLQLDLTHHSFKARGRPRLIRELLIRA